MLEMETTGVHSNPPVPVLMETVYHSRLPCDMWCIAKRGTQEYPASCVERVELLMGRVAIREILHVR